MFFSHRIWIILILHQIDFCCSLVFLDPYGWQTAKKSKRGLLASAQSTKASSTRHKVPPLKCDGWDTLCCLTLFKTVCSLAHINFTHLFHHLPRILQKCHFSYSGFYPIYNGLCHLYPCFKAALIQRSEKINKPSWISKQFTSLRKVWAAFWAPTCNRYS